ncbi:FAD-dependent monooxygenase [Pararhizobium sp. PWRC1-1]|uniref:FAD binding domain-containing protein n=1 Tax=Pararhizobium sp. PWRC1-1 TaxID=2804566 RepID=UPI003CF18F14
MVTATSLRIRIVGGSLAGLFCGALLHRAGHDVLIFERSGSDLATRGAGLVGGADLFNVLRLLRCEHVTKLAVTATSQVLVNLDGSIVSERQVGISRFSWDLLYKSARRKIPDALYVQSRRVVAVEDGKDAAKLYFEGGDTETADVIIGADGIASIARKSVNPVDYLNSFAGYVAWRAVISEADLPHAILALKEKMVAYSAPGIQSVGYLIPGRSGEIGVGLRRYNWGWYRPVKESDLPELFTDNQGRLNHFSLPRGKLQDPARLSFAADARRLLPPQFAEIAAATPDPWIQGIFDYAPNRITGKRIALVGDAAFLIRPHTAMGTSKAAGDAIALTEAIALAGTVGEALEKYAKSRLPVGQWLAERGRDIGGSLGLSPQVSITDDDGNFSHQRAH